MFREEEDDEDMEGFSFEWESTLHSQNVLMLHSIN
jgi:hypothetical protein